ncbi:DUF2163 domain-containing protein [Jannaschia seohaensis]|uniref:Putative phage protein (TIGR02218 family) n=1 Tax=Jannaschia seohaensis TaxID=475081 RepID=A0A2Y9AR74_9RHOB|nr:DUF2163 domain-containing protein [Jannaschia seohaensis]PWJ19156.1 putative phage protein (TIGR02218 family) [Jannaschia seohaensis]SSA45818.1 phage conserved hypothetical protein BR0599 [Jannaschia seohaensis]
MTGLLGRFAGGVSTICRAWVLTRTDGRVFGFTDHDASLTVDGVTCVAESGMTAGALEAATGLSVDNTEAVGALRHDGLTEADMRAGRWDDAAVVAYLVDWRLPSAFEVVFRGTLGELSVGEGAFTAELRGLSEALNRVRGRVYQPRCDAVLGDLRCGVDLADPTFFGEGVVDAVEEGRVLSLSGLAAFADGWFARGRIEVLDGAAAGLVEQIKRDVGQAERRVELWGALRADLAVGDRVRVEAGCDKRAETCRAKFSNFWNFRGFPHIPGDDWLMAYPTSGKRNDGGRL